MENKHKKFRAQYRIISQSWKIDAIQAIASFSNEFNLVAEVEDIAELVNYVDGVLTD